MLTTLAYHNPYTDQSWQGCFFLFIKRFFTFIQGRLSIENLASDELQLIILSAIAISCAITGSLLIFRKMTMLANALSHTVLFGIVITFFILNKSFDYLSLAPDLSVLFLAAIITSVLTIGLIELVCYMSRLQKDASIGLVFTTLFAASILLITLFSRNSQVGVDLIMGNVDAMHKSDVAPILWMAFYNVAFIFIFYRGLKLTTFDSIFAKLQGVSPALFKYLLIFQLSITTLGSFRAVGVVLVLGFLIVPSLIAKLFTKSLKTLILLACFMGFLSAAFGVALSRHFLSQYQTPLSTGGLTICVLYSFYFLSWGSQKAFYRIKNAKYLKDLKIKFLVSEN